MSAPSPSGPALSYVVPTDTWESTSIVVGALCEQTAAAAIELVLVAPNGVELGTAPPATSALHSVGVVEHAGGTVPAARLEGIRAARGGVVALGETHVVPERRWAEGVLATHAAGADVVLARIGNANPRSALSWGAYLMDYGRYGAYPDRRPMPEVPMYNATMRRELVLGLHDPEWLLSSSTLLDAAVREADAVVVAHDESKLDHLNVDQPLHWVLERYLGGRLTAATRRRHWGAARRLGYATGFPLIAAVLARRALRPITPYPSRAVPAVAAGCLAWAFGEAMGYVFGEGNAGPRMREYENRKHAYVRQW